jgi:Domain of unknown function (DUF1990)
MRFPELGFRDGDLDARLRALGDRPLNYDPATVGGPGWSRDDYSRALPPGSFDVACRLSRDYAFSDPSLVEAHFDRDAKLEGREMLLVLHALGLRFYAGVRVADVNEETRERDGRPARVFAWSYRTLEGHVEAGRRDFEVWQRLDTNEVEFRTHSLSRPAARNPIVLAGFRVIGRHKQAEFGRRACARMEALARAALAAADA